jgi:hypothetical protein
MSHQPPPVRSCAPTCHLLDRLLEQASSQSANRDLTA